MEKNRKIKKDKKVLKSLKKIKEPINKIFLVNIAY